MNRDDELRPMQMLVIAFGWAALVVTCLVYAEDLTDSGALAAAIGWLRSLA